MFVRLANGFLNGCMLDNLANFLNRNLALLDYLLGRTPRA